MRYQELNYFRVLVIDDNFVVRDLFRYAIQKIAFRYEFSPFAIKIVEADNGKEAWTLLHQHSFDLVIVDLYMPVMDGDQLIRCIRAHEVLKNTPVVVVSCGGREARQRAIQTGADAYLDKPIRLKEISETIESFMIADREKRKPS